MTANAIAAAVYDEVRRGAGDALLDELRTARLVLARRPSWSA